MGYRAKVKIKLEEGGGGGGGEDKGREPVDILLMPPFRPFVFNLHGNKSLVKRLVSLVKSGSTRLTRGAYISQNWPARPVHLQREFHF